MSSTEILVIVLGVVVLGASSTGYYCQKYHEASTGYGCRSRNKSSVAVEFRSTRIKVRTCLGLYPTLRYCDQEH